MLKAEKGKVIGQKPQIQKAKQQQQLEQEQSRQSTSAAFVCLARSQKSLRLHRAKQQHKHKRSKQQFWKNLRKCETRARCIRRLLLNTRFGRVFGAACSCAVICLNDVEFRLLHVVVSHVTRCCVALFSCVRSFVFAPITCSIAFGLDCVSLGLVVVALILSLCDVQNRKNYPLSNFSGLRSEANYCRGFVCLLSHSCWCSCSLCFVLSVSLSQFACCSLCCCLQCVLWRGSPETISSHLAKGVCCCWSLVFVVSCSIMDMFQRIHPVCTLF